MKKSNGIMTRIIFAALLVIVNLNLYSQEVIDSINVVFIYNKPKAKIMLNGNDLPLQYDKKNQMYFSSGVRVAELFKGKDFADLTVKYRRVSLLNVIKPAEIKSYLVIFIDKKRKPQYELNWSWSSVFPRRID